MVVLSARRRTIAPSAAPTGALTVAALAIAALAGTAGCTLTVDIPPLPAVPIADRGSASNTCDVIGFAVPDNIFDPPGAGDSAFSAMLASGRHLRCGDAGLPAGRSARSISMWVRFADLAFTRALLLNYGTRGVKGGSFTLYYNRSASGYGLQTGDTNPRATVSNVSAATNRWLHVVLVLAASADSVQIYADGAPVNVQDNASALLDTKLSGQLTIGARFDGTEPVNGSVDEIRIYDRALDAAAAKALHDNPLEALGGELSWWRFDE